MALLNTDIELKERILSITTKDFENLAIDLFRFQYANNIIYQDYCNAIKVKVSSVHSVSSIPFLPIHFFKTKQVCTTSFSPESVFESSGTTGSVNSKHYIRDLSLYENNFLAAFRSFYGEPEQYCILGLLPSYLERKNSSLVYMVNELIKKSRHEKSGFFLHETGKLLQTIRENEQNNQPTLLIGVAYALLDFFELNPMQLHHTTIMETGGMKGRRKELTKQELHNQLKQRTGLTGIHSEYGMTELLSQAYSKENGIFYCPPQMKVLLRAEDDPFEIIVPALHSGDVMYGAVNIIDLANLYSCSFIATDDMGKSYPDGGFEITGRLENSDIRGCGLMLL